MSIRFSSLDDLLDNLWKAANVEFTEQNQLRTIYFKLEPDEIEKRASMISPEMQRQNWEWHEDEANTIYVIQDANQDEQVQVRLLKWEDLKSGAAKVRPADNENWWVYYDDSAKGGRKKTRRKKCKRKNKSKRIDAGYYDKYRGWYDVQGCGKCYDYCRWVGNSGPGGNPKNKTIKKIKGKSKSWWSCRLVKKKGRYSTRKKWKKGFNYKKCVREGQVTRLPLQGNKSMFGGGLFKGKSTISTNFESGNINHIKNIQRKNDVNIILEIENEPYPSNTKKKYQNWFYFKSNNVQRKSITYTIQNIRIFDDDWRGFNVCYSYDNKNWKRIKTSFSKKNKTLTWTHKSSKKNVFFAYYPPYTIEMKNKLINKYKNRKNVKHILLNKNIDTLLLGSGPLHIYIVARQHPGETIGSWMAEGFLNAYFSSKQRKIIEKTFTIVVIPMANPSGVKSGHWYTNKKGQNLNRSWRHNKTPETTAIKKLINF